MSRFNLDVGHGAHPAIRSSTHRAWLLDEASGVAGAELADSTATADLGALGVEPTPVVLPGPVGPCRSFDGTSMLRADGDAATDAVALSDWTLGAWVRVRADPNESDCIVVYGGPNGDGDGADNFLIGFRIRTDRTPEMFWEHTTGATNIISALDGGGDKGIDYVLPVNRWLYIAWRKRNTTGAGPGETCDLDLFINGHLVETWSGIVPPDGGSNSDWMVGGCRTAGGATADTFEGDVAGVYFWDTPLTPEQIVEDWRRGSLVSFHTRCDIAVEYQDQAGATIDLTDHLGYDWVDEVTVGDTGDQPNRTGGLKCIREVERVSLAPLRTDSIANLTDLDDPLSYSNLIREHADIEILAARVPLGTIARDTDRVSVLKGRTKRVDFSSDPMTIALGDKGDVLLRTIVEDVQSYGSVAGVPSVTVMQAILDDNDNSVRTGSYDPITLFAPDPPTQLLKPFGQRKENLSAALRTIAGSTGRDFRYRFDPDPDVNDWVPTFYAPDRTTPIVDFVLANVDILSVSDASLDPDPVRNVVRIAYPSSQQPAATAPGPFDDFIYAAVGAGVDHRDQRIMAYLQLENTTSRDRYGRAFMEASEAATSQIDTIVEANAMALAINQDLNEPEFAHAVSTPCLFELDPQDMGKFLSNRFLYTGDQRLASHRVTHTFGELATSSTAARGSPSVGFRRWLEIETRGGNAKPPTVTPEDALADLGIGTLLAFKANSLERTDDDVGGFFTQVRNSSFESFTRGRDSASPPDGWSMETGVWGVDIVEDTSISVSGGRALRWDDASAVLQSDEIFVPGANIAGETLPYLLQFVARSSVAVAQNHSVTVRFLDENKAFLSDALFFPTGGAVFPADTWLTHRMGTVLNGALPTGDSIEAPSTARYARLLLAAPAATPSYFDSVNFYRASRQARASRPVNIVNIVNGLFVKASLSVVDQDYGGNHDTGNGQFLIVETGVYDVFGKFTAANVGGGSSIEAQSRIVITGAGTTNITGPGSTVIRTVGGDDLLESEVQARVLLTKGSTVELYGRILTSGGGAPVRRIVGGSTETWLSIKLTGND